MAATSQAVAGGTPSSESAVKLDNESRSQVLVGEFRVIVAKAGQIFRSVTECDHGIDGESEFKDDDQQATGQKVYAHRRLKSERWQPVQRERQFIVS